jgi:hypothetical protein
MPLGDDVTVPLPLPFLATESWWMLSVKVAVTAAATLIVTLHTLVPEQPAPDQPVNDELLAGAADSVTTVSWL